MQKSKKKKLFIFLGVVVLLLIIVIANLSRKGGGGIKVQSDKAVRGTIVSTVSGPAKIQPEVQVKISAQVSGKIVKLGVQEGEYVREGQFLVQLDPEFYQAATEQAESNLRFATAGFEKAKNEYSRTDALFKNNLASQADLDLARSSYEQAKAQVEQSAAVLKQAKDNLAKTTLYAPMDGMVSQLNKKVGEMAMGSQFTLDVIMVVADLSKMLAETEIDENDVVSVSLQDTANIVVDAFPDSTFKGVVKEIANTGQIRGSGTQEEVTNFTVKVSMLEMPSRIRPSMSATVDIVTETKNGVVKVPIQCVTIRTPLPKEAVTDSAKADSASAKKAKPPKKKKQEKKPDSTATAQAEKEPVRVVFVIKEGIVHQREVKTGIPSDTEWEILEGLEEGEEVVSGSYRVLTRDLKDGDEVKIDNSAKKFTQE